MSRAVVFVLFLILDGEVGGIYYGDLLHPYRIYRHCHRVSVNKAHAHGGLEGSRVTLGLVFVSAFICLLIALGVIKGLIGLCVAPVGKYGLYLLIDLPRPLAHYQEKELMYRPVVYDVGGWPIHPDTQQRTVRVLSKRTEFCLNVIFFLACPLAACAYVCSLCCCIRNWKEDSCEKGCFKHVDIIRLETGSANDDGSDKNIYMADRREEEDTRYVINAMQSSKESLHQLGNK